MKIEIKPFNDGVRFTPPITFKRLKKRTVIVMGGSLFWRKPSPPEIFGTRVSFFNS
jgi:hypothetical protein